MSELITARDFVKLLVEEEKDDDFKRYTGYATVLGRTDGGKVIVKLDGDLQTSGKARSRLESYRPRKGDRVLVFDDVVLGKII